MRETYNCALRILKLQILVGYFGFCECVKASLPLFPSLPLPPSPQAAHVVILEVMLNFNVFHADDGTTMHTPPSASVMYEMSKITFSLLQVIGSVMR